MNCVICGKELTERQIKKNKKVCSLSCAMKLRFKNPVERQKLSNTCKKVWSTTNVRERISNSVKNKWQEKGYREKISGAIKDGQKRNNAYEKISITSKERWSNSEYKEKVSNKIKESLQKEETKIKLRNKSKRLWTSKEYRNKIITSIRLRWQNDTYKRNVIEKIKSHWENEEFRQKIGESISRTLKNKWKNDQIFRQKMYNIFTSKEVRQKIYQTKKKNHSFNTSKPGQETYQILKELFNDTQTQYKDERYPYNCDFYIPQYDLFIECNYLWTHGSEPYDETNENHRKNC